MSKSRTPRIARRHFLLAAAAGALAVTGGTITPARPGQANTRTILKSGDLEVLVVSDGYFVLPTGFLVAPETPTPEREAVLKAAGQGGEQLQLANNVTILRKGSDVVLVDAGTGPHHQPSAGKLAENLRAVGIQPAAITKVVLTHGHPDHLWGVLHADDRPVYPNAIYFVSSVEWNVWADPDVAQKLPAVFPKERAASIATGTKHHFSRIKDKVTMVRGGDEIVGGIRIVTTPGHTPGHISVEVAGDGGLVIAGDALTHRLISFRYPSWRVPVDCDADDGIATRLRLLDQLATDKQRLIGAHLPFPGSGFVERKDGSYRFVTS
ncbi:MAG: MBL fold metallo-hydrolase [Mesorhizobium sp.]|uniref:MBL fold metallo-hydrolase n=1 Tax=Mesorhizobium sp. TaxID=1871066 RepID=UPI000FE478A8|nr:MBL fold metallo-hydrolase [Mesorhizobium sp.]RWM87062.1 MAG: MBL fold metallo-hydrolase [Mesorhizobium sp.]